MVSWTTSLSSDDKFIQASTYIRYEHFYRVMLTHRHDSACCRTIDICPSADLSEPFVGLPRYDTIRYRQFNVDSKLKR